MPERRGAGLDHRDGLRVAVVIDEEGARFRLRDALGHRHRFGRRRRLVQQRGVGDVAARSGRRPSSGSSAAPPAGPGDLGLVGGVGRVPGGIFEDVALDRGRRDRAVDSPARSARSSPGSSPATSPHVRQKLVFGQRRQVERLFLPDRWPAPSGRSARPGSSRPRTFSISCHLRRRRADVAAVGEVVGLIVGGGEGHCVLLQAASVWVVRGQLPADSVFST